MIMRITWGTLQPGTWQEFERTYQATVMGKEFKGLRGRWLAQDVNDSDGGLQSTYGTCSKICGPMSRAPSSNHRSNRPFSPFL